MSVLVVLEQRSGNWNRMSFEALTAGQRIGEALGIPVEGVVIGADIAELAKEAASYGFSKLFAATHPLLAQYTPEAYTAALEQLIKAQNGKAIVFPHTYQVRDYAPKLAARFGQSLICDVVDLKPDGAQLMYVRQLFQGKLNADVRASSDPQFVSIQAGAFRAAEPGTATAPIEDFDVQLDSSQIRSKPEEPFREAQRSVDLNAADVIVSVGRGIKEKDNLPVVEALARALGAELAASRPICDNGWLPMERQVGSSGQTVSPKAYFAVGISGAIQHLVGMKGSKTVVAINKDENAPIFETADYGVVGDLFEVVPALVEEIEKAKK
ncbi:MAG: electron transfer flavoprotein subunit alpha/FixB family protein [Acidobacteriaceae bacterium]|nr:electron transfer flavoprotein subunit alpha/FixB family protein [Acidobacteriaceae bacterium]MBV9781719.1 electron transfer flavoprotein subunit alpha/FixB family protein [Acidobacteriaceae bacterium]